MNKTVLIKDAIIGREINKDVFFGSVQYEQPAKPNTIATIRTDKAKIQIPLNQIDLIIFRYDAKTFGLIFNNCLFTTDKKDFNSWNRQTKSLHAMSCSRTFKLRKRGVSHETTFN